MDIISEHQRIKDLRADGLSIRKIAEKLGFSKSQVGRVLNESVPSVPEVVPESVPVVPKCPTPEVGETLGELKVKLNLLLKKLYLRVDTIEKRQRDIEEEFNSRADRIINHLVNNTLRAYVEQELKKMKGELIEQLKRD